MSPAAPASDVALTRSQIENWDFAHLDAAAARWRASASESEELFEQHRQSVSAPGGTDWQGSAKDAAWERVRADTTVVGRQGEVLVAAADIAVAGVSDLRAAQRAALEAMVEAEADGFRVPENFLATDTRRIDISTMSARYRAAAEHTENMRWHAEQLLATDKLIAQRISAKAAELDTIMFDGETRGSDGSVQFVNNEEEKSPKDEAMERVAEPRSEVAEPGTWPPPGTPVSGGTPGGEHYGPSGLGPPVPGESLSERPKPPEWTPKDVGSGGDATFGTWESRLPSDQLDKWEIDAVREGIASVWPEAERNMSHYFGVSGAPLEQDVGKMLNDLPSFRESVDTRMQELGASAINQAQASGATGPLTFPVNTDWIGNAIPQSDRNWYLAVGNFDYNLGGEVTVYPPTQPGGQWTYSMDADLNMRDRYNWDVQKATPIAGVPISDNQLGRFHMIGWAKEFTMYGSTGVHSGN